MAYGNIEEHCAECFSAAVVFDAVEYSKAAELTMYVCGERRVSLESASSDWPDEESAAQAIVRFCTLLGVEIDRIEGPNGEHLNPEDFTP